MDGTADELARLRNIEARAKELVAMYGFSSLAERYKYVDRLADAVGADHPRTAQLREMAEAEDRCGGVAVGGLAVELGLYNTPADQPGAEQVAIDHHASPAVVEACRRYDDARCGHNPGIAERLIGSDLSFSSVEPTQQEIIHRSAEHGSEETEGMAGVRRLGEETGEGRPGQGGQENGQR